MANSDGRMPLNKERLKAHRKKLGLSQEQMANECAEKGLYVSVASLKRAETGKRVIYRTARDISQFLGVDLTELIDNSVASDTPEALLQDNRFSLTQNPLNVCILFTTASTISKTALTEQLSALFADLPISNATLSSDQSSNQFTFSLASPNQAQNSNLPQIVYQTIFGASKQLSAIVGEFCVCIYLSQQAKQDKQYHELFEPLTLSSIDLLSQYNQQVLVCGQVKGPMSQAYNCSEIDAQNTTPTPKLWLVECAMSSPVQELKLAGRSLEVDQFKNTLKACGAHRKLQIICLRGEAGIGKTRLLKEFISLSKHAHYQNKLVQASNNPNNHHNTVIQQIFHALVALLDQPGLNARQGAWRLRLSDHEQRLLNSILETKGEQNLGFDYISAQELNEQQLLICSKLAKQATSKKPLLLCLEDAHWLDPGTLEFIKQLLLLLADSPIIFLCTKRPSDSAMNTFSQLSLKVAVNTVNLAPLTIEEARSLALQLSSQAQIQDICIEKSQGNPLFLEQLLRTPFADQSQIPFSIHSLVAEKVSRLQEIDQRAIIAASVIGQNFDIGLVRKLIKQADYQPCALINEFLISNTPAGLSFNHALICDAIYSSLDQDACLTLNKECALWFSKHDSILELRYLLRVNSENVNSKLLPTINTLLKSHKFELALEFIDAYLAAGVYPDLFEVIYIKIDLLHKLGKLDEALEFTNTAKRHNFCADENIDLLLLEANILNTLDKFDEALLKLSQAEKLAIEHDIPHAVAKISYLKGNFYFPKGEIDKCTQSHQRALDEARKINNVEIQARALGGLCDAAYSAGKMYTAYSHVQECLKLSEQHNLTAVKASNLFMLGTVRIYQNQFEQALQDTYAGINLTSLVGHCRAEIVSKLTASWIHIDLYELDEAHDNITSAIELANTIGALRFVPFLQESLARVEYHHGNTDKAQAIINEALVRVTELGAEKFIGPWLYATAALVSDQQDEALAQLTQGEALLAKGCIGHNYFRYYSLAMDCCIKFKLWQQLEHYKNALQEYTLTEPTPWSQFYIQRANSLLQQHQSQQFCPNAINIINIQAEQAGLFTAKLSIDQFQTEPIKVKA